MTENLKKWIDENNLTISELENEFNLDIVEISNVGKFLYIKAQDGKIFDDEFSFQLSDAEYDAIEKNLVNFILFEFGTKFYYSKIISSRNRYNEEVYKPEFTDFKYLDTSSEEDIMDFVHLGVHDEYEMLNGSGSTDLWAKKAVFLRHKALGVCNKNTLASSLCFQTAVEKQGIKAILGETVDVAVNYDPEQDIQELFELKLYVLNSEGWKNLLMVNKCINVDYNNFIPLEELCKYGKGLALVISSNSELNYYKEDKKRCKRLIKTYKANFDEVYYQIDTVRYASSSLFKKHLSNIDYYIMNYRNLVKPILINDSYYLDEEEKDLKGMLNKVAGKASAEGLNQYYKSVNQTLRSYEEWIDDVEPLLEVIVDGIQNTVELSNKVSFRIDNADRKLPDFEVDDPEELFFEKLQEGIDRKLVGKVKNLDEYMKRIETECELIVPNDLCSYFLILWDIVNWCKEQNIMVGPGRGSVCGSLVAYCLDITQIDPIPYGLYFERFLSKSRVEICNEVFIHAGGEVKRIFDYDDVKLSNGKIIKAKDLKEGDDIDDSYYSAII